MSFYVPQLATHSAAPGQTEKWTDRQKMDRHYYFISSVLPLVTFKIILLLVCLCALCIIPVGNTRIVGQSSLQKFQDEMGKVMKDPYKVCINSITWLSAFQCLPYFLEKTPWCLFIWQPDHAAFFQCHSTYSTTHAHYASLAQA